MQKNAKQDKGTLKDVLERKKQDEFGFIDPLPELPMFKKDIITIIQLYDNILNDLPPADHFESQFGRFTKSSYLKFRKEDLEQRYQVMDDCVYEHNGN